MPSQKQAAATPTKTVAQLSIEELIASLSVLAANSRSVGNIAIGNAIEKNAAFLLRETGEVFANSASLETRLRSLEGRNEELGKALKRYEKLLLTAANNAHDDDDEDEESFERTINSEIARTKAALTP